MPPSDAGPQPQRPETTRPDHAESNLDQWVATLSQVEIPVLRGTVDELARLEKNKDNITARDISGIILRDPMLTLRVLRYLQEHRKNAQATEITTVGHAVMMLGITPFFRQFRDLNVIEAVLADRPHALEGFMAVISRAHHAAHYARDWAALRHDTESDEVIIAALLHDVAEMLLWCLAPASAMQIAEQMQQDTTLRSTTAQQGVLGFRLIDLQLALVETWHLPALLQTLMDDDHGNSPRARIVVLAVALARHSAHGWENAALPDDYAAVQKFLALSRHEVRERIRRAALRAVRGLGSCGVLQPAAWLPPWPAAWADAECDGDGEGAAARAAVLKRVTDLLTVRAAQNPDFLETLALVFHGMHAGVGLERVLFMEIDGAHGTAAARYVTGSREASQLRKLTIDLAYPHVFSRLIGDPAGVWYGAAIPSELTLPLPEDIRRIIGPNEFFAMAIAVNGDPVGLIYADGGAGRPVLDRGRYAEFQRLCLLFAASLQREPRTGHFL